MKYNELKFNYPKQFCCNSGKGASFQSNPTSGTTTAFGWYIDYNDPGSDLYTVTFPGTNSNGFSSDMDYSWPLSAGFYIGFENSQNVRSQIQYTKAEVGAYAGWKFAPGGGVPFTAANLQTFWNHSEYSFSVGTSHLAEALTSCPIPPLGGIAMPDSMEVNFAIGSKVTYTCPAGYTFDLGIDWRKVVLTCTAGGTWDPLSVPSCVLNAYGFCDPSCLNGGTCSCAGPSCVCQCPSGFSGPDCSFESSFNFFGSVVYS